MPHTLFCEFIYKTGDPTPVEFGAGGIALAIGLYFMKYHDPDYRRPLIIELVIASLCIVAGSVGVVIVRYRKRMVAVAASTRGAGGEMIMSGVQQVKSDGTSSAARATRQ